MTVEEILQGESKDLEFKEKLPEDSKKYMKTIVAFSNGDGGRLIIGVNDDREIVNKDIEVTDADIKSFCEDMKKRGPA